MLLPLHCGFYRISGRGLSQKIDSGGTYFGKHSIRKCAMKYCPKRMERITHRRALSLVAQPARR